MPEENQTSTAAVQPEVIQPTAAIAPATPNSADLTPAPAPTPAPTDTHPSVAPTPSAPPPPTQTVSAPVVVPTPATPPTVTPPQPAANPAPAAAPAQESFSTTPREIGQSVLRRIMSNVWRRLWSFLPW